MFTGIAYGLWIAAVAATAVILLPATSAAVVIIDCGNGQVRDLDMLATAGRSGGGAGEPAERAISLSIENRTGTDLTHVEARQALDGALAGTAIVRRPQTSHGSVEYDSRGLMWQGDLSSGQRVGVGYAVTVPDKPGGGFQQLRPGSRFQATLSSTAAECA